MTRKLIIDVDPGIGDTLAIVTALMDPEIDLLAVTATGGCVSGAVATRNLQGIVERLDPPKWPRVGAAPELSDADAALSHEVVQQHEGLNGRSGLGDFELRVAELRSLHDSSKLLTDLVRSHPHQVTLLTLGPLTNVAAACERAPDFMDLLGRLVCLGGSVSEGGDVTAAAEFNMCFNAEAANIVLGNPNTTKTLVPLDITRRVMLTFEAFQKLGESASPVASFLQDLLPYSFRAHHQFLGLEGMLLPEVTALAAVAQPRLFRVEHMSVAVERYGQLTRGMTVFDRRPNRPHSTNISVATEVDVQGVLDYLTRVLGSAHSAEV